MILSFYLNFNNFIMGPHLKLFHFVVRSFLLWVAAALILLKKQKTVCGTYNIYWLYSNRVTGIITHRLSADYLVPFVLIAIPPFYGLRLFCNISSSCLIIFVLGTLLPIVNVYFWKKKRGPGE